MATITSTSTSTTDRALIRAELGAAGTTVLTDLAGAEPWKPVPLRRSGSGKIARVGLAGTRASLIAGDDIELQIHVGPGASLEVTEVAALILHNARGGSATMRTEINVAPDATLIWLGEPVIAAAGCRATRTMAAALGERARLLLGERIVLGRVNERSGALLSRQRITQAGQVVLDECLDTSELDTLRSPIVAGPSARMLASLTTIGCRATGAPEVMQLHLEGSMWRMAGAAHTVSAAMLALADVWCRALDTDRTGDHDTDKMLATV
jgi:urease accessory protein